MEVKWDLRNLSRFSVCLLIFNGGTERMESSTEIPHRNNFYIIWDSETWLLASLHFTSERVSKVQESKEWLLLTETVGTGPVRRFHCIAVLTSFCHHRRQSEKVLKTPSGLFQVPPGAEQERASLSSGVCRSRTGSSGCVPLWTLRTSRLPCFPGIPFLPADMVPSFFVSGWCDPVCGNIASAEKKLAQPHITSHATSKHICRRLITRRQWG